MMWSALVVFLGIAGTLVQAQNNILSDAETVLTKKGHYTMFLNLLKRTTLLDTLKNSEEITLFAPTNQALSQIPYDEYQDLLNDPDRLNSLLSYHVTTDAAFHTTGQSNDVVLTSSNNNLPIRINVYRQVHTISAEGANITERNIKIENGFIQGIDEIMWPPEGDVVDIVTNHDELGTTATFLSKAGLIDTIRNDRNITVFAPLDEAWEDLDDEIVEYLEKNPTLLEEVLLYHVVQDTTLYSIGMRHSMTFKTADHHKDDLVLIEDDNDDFLLNDVRIDEMDMSATNGVVHTVERVLIPTSVLVMLEDQGFDHLTG